MMTVLETVKQRVRKTFNNHCAYCLSAQQYLMQVLEIDHITPIAKGGTNDEDNLCLACRLCNLYKSNHTHSIDSETNQMTPLFNPRTDKWTQHFRWSQDGFRVIGLTAVGRVTIKVLRLNNETAILTRTNWVSVGWHPPK
ncbi:MAG: HNH endonuclease signature motif containing protein [Anaerolineae bacterium]|nr:HNH endonuclease signature motif containing protein [Anaerolineae bacterium]